jgi:modulator of FtsH protease HflC
MQAYERSMQHGDTHLVLRPDSDFFRYFGDPSGKSPPAGTNTQTAAPPPGPAAAANPASASSATK